MTLPSAYAGMPWLADKTVSGNPPPTGFLITLWALAIFFTVATIAMLVGGIRNQLGARSRRIPDPSPRPGVRDATIDPTGRAGRAGCLFTVAVPCALLAVLFIGWLIGIS